MAVTLNEHLYYYEHKRYGMISNNFLRNIKLKKHTWNELYKLYKLSDCDGNTNKRKHEEKSPVVDKTV